METNVLVVMKENEDIHKTNITFVLKQDEFEFFKQIIEDSLGFYREALNLISEYEQIEDVIDPSGMLGKIKSEMGRKVLDKLQSIGINVQELNK